MADKRYDQRGKSSLGSTADHRMRLYELAAAAASVSALALAQPAEAEIIITNKTIPIHAETPVMLDLNGDGIADFQFYLRTSSYHSVGENYLYLQKLTAGGGAIGQGQAVSALIRGAKIGPGGPFGRFVGVIENSFLCTTKRCAGGTQSGYTFNQHTLWGLGRRPSQPIYRREVPDQGANPLRLDTFDRDDKAQREWPWPDRIIFRHHNRVWVRVGREQVVRCGITGSGCTRSPSWQLGAQTGRLLRTEPTLGMLALGADALPLWRRDDPLDSN